MPKDFKTIDELIDLLESRGVQTDEDTPKILQRESYYAIINGYKDAFLDRDLMQSSGDDVYKPGTRFDDIYSLFLYDRMLRHDVMPFIMSAETIVKNAAAAPVESVPNEKAPHDCGAVTCRRVRHVDCNR